MGSELCISDRLERLSPMLRGETSLATAKVWLEKVPSKANVADLPSRDDALALPDVIEAAGLDGFDEIDLGFDPSDFITPEIKEIPAAAFPESNDPEVWQEYRRKQTSINDSNAVAFKQVQAQKRLFQGSAEKFKAHGCYRDGKVAVSGKLRKTHA